MSIFSELKKDWNRDFVFRKEIGKLTGGLISPATMANLDSSGKGIKNEKIGNKVIYNINDVITWLEENTVLHNFEK